MANMKCTNEECPEYDIPKLGITGMPADEFTCGGCGTYSLVETDEEPPAPEPPPEE